LALLAAAGLSAAQQKAGPPDLAAVQKERAATMKAINYAMREIYVGSKKGEMAGVAKAAAEVADLVEKIPALSPEGSNLGETRIKPEVWKNFDHYEKLSAQAAQAARMLVQVAGGGDRAAVMKSFAALANSCNECHKPYRIPKDGD